MINKYSSPLVSIQIKTVSTKSELKDFIFLPEKIHADHQNWLPPIYSDEWNFYNPKRNKVLSKSDTVILLAYKNGKLSGRIMGIINKQYNELHQERGARFFNFDCYDDAEVAHALLDGVEKWARDKGMNEMTGPFGFSDKDPQGAQVEGFEHISVLATATNKPGIPLFIEENGYKKKVDCLVYQLDVPEHIPEIYMRVSERILRSGKFRLFEFKSRKALKPWIVPVFRLVNETYKSIFGFMPMSEEEMKIFAKQYLPVLDPEFTKLVVDESNQPVAFIVSTPDISKGIIKAKGRIFPFGFIHILRSGRKSSQLDFFLGAVKDQYQNTGLTSILGAALFRTAIRRNMKTIDSHLILETNYKMRAVMERLGAMVYKRYRIYTKQL